MKRSVEIIGLPVISISDGKELGYAKMLVVNAAKKSIDAIAIDDGRWYLATKILPVLSIIGIGEYAITIENENSLVTVATESNFKRLLEADVKVIGSKVLTRSGKIFGQVNEMIIDNKGKIYEIEVEQKNGTIVNIDGGALVTISKDVVIIDEAVSSTVASSSTVQVYEKQVEQQNLGSIKDEINVDAQQPVSDDAAKKFDEKHRKYLLGKKASRRIETDNGMLIVDQGGEITEEVLQKAKLAGKFVELSMNIQ